MTPAQVIRPEIDMVTSCEGHPHIPSSHSGNASNSYLTQARVSIQGYTQGPTQLLQPTALQAWRTSAGLTCKMAAAFAWDFPLLKPAVLAWMAHTSQAQHMYSHVTANLSVQQPLLRSRIVVDIVARAREPDASSMKE